MASIISAGTTSGTSLNLSGDTSGVLQLATNGSTTAVTVDTSQNVGIGTSSPTRRLHLYASATCDMTIQAGNTTDYSYLYFGDSASATQAWIGYYHTEDSMRFATNAAERMRITSGGNVGIGTTSPANPLEVNQGSTSSTAGVKVSGPTWVSLDLVTTNADSGARNWRLAGVQNGFGIFELMSGSTVGGTPDTTVLSAKKGSSIALEGASTQTGTGITFPATQSASSNANTLDDYEEGTWTPSVGGTATYQANNYGRYTKIGNVVTVQFRISISTIGTGSSGQLQGLPFTSANLSNVQTGCVSYYDNIAISTTFVAFYVENNATTIQFVTKASSGTAVDNGPAIMGNSTTIFGSATYRVA